MLMILFLWASTSGIGSNRAELTWSIVLYGLYKWGPMAATPFQSDFSSQSNKMQKGNFIEELLSLVHNSIEDNNLTFLYTLKCCPCPSLQHHLYNNNKKLKRKWSGNNVIKELIVWRTILAPSQKFFHIVSGLG